MLLVIIGIGIAVGLAYSFVRGKGAADETCGSVDSALLYYLFPLLFAQIGSRFELGQTQLKLAAVMFAAMLISLLAALLVAKVLSKDSLVRNGFVILATCANTGHGLMLMATTTSENAIFELALGAFYVGFLWVIFVPQLLTDRSQLSFKGQATLILMHPVSYGCIIGFAIAIHPALGVAYLFAVMARLIFGKDLAAFETWKPAIAMLAAVVYITAMHVAKADATFATITQLFAGLMTLVTAFTIGLKMRAKMTWNHIVIVIAINVFGLILAPAIGLGLAWGFGFGRSEAYVLAFLLSQPPAYLAMVWLRSGKFGSLSISEWAFVIQAILAYIWATIFADSPLLAWLFPG